MKFKKLLGKYKIKMQVSLADLAPTLLTDHLVLRHYTPKDAQALFDTCMSDEEVMKHCDWELHTDVSQTVSYIKEHQYNRHKWGIILQDTAKLIGCIEVWRDVGDVVSLDYMLGKAYWNKGYMTEALGAVIDELFSEGYTAVFSNYIGDNKASGRVMEHCGMKLVGVTPMKHILHGQTTVTNYVVINPELNTSEATKLFESMQRTFMTPHLFD